MLVVNWMSPRLVTVAPDEPILGAMKLLKDHQISRLAVLDAGGALVGIVTDRDLKRASPSDSAGLEMYEIAYQMGRIKVGDTMTPDPVTIGIYDAVDEAALLMLEKRVSGLPVKDTDGHIIAMITQTDVFRAMVTVTGALHGGVQFALDLPDVSGSIGKAAMVLRRRNARILSILTSYDRVAQGRRKVYIRAKNLDRSELDQIKEELSQTGVLLYILDSSGDRRELVAMGRYAR